MNDPADSVIADGRNQPREIQDVTPHHADRFQVDTYRSEKPLIDGDIEDHRPLAFFQEHAHRVGPDQAAAAGYECPVFTHDPHLPLFRMLACRLVDFSPSIYR